MTRIEEAIIEVQDALKASACPGYASDPIWRDPTPSGIATYEAWVAGFIVRDGDPWGKLWNVGAKMAALRALLPPR
jgi:hypothetical protein